MTILPSVRTGRVARALDRDRHDDGPTRRHFLSLAAAAAIGSLLPGGVGGRLLARPIGGQGHHPEPRPGIDGSKVLGAGQLADSPHLIELFDSIRAIPHIVDGIRCYCGCAGLEGYRSLLSCYEAPAMARFCEICEGQGRLAVRRHREGQTLDQIRRATDARYGDHGGTQPSAAGGDDHCTR